MYERVPLRTWVGAERGNRVLSLHPYPTPRRSPFYGDDATERGAWIRLRADGIPVRGRRRRARCAGFEDHTLNPHGTSVALHGPITTALSDFRQSRAGTE